MNASVCVNYAAVGIVGALTTVSCDFFRLDALADGARCVLSNALLFYFVYASYFFLAALVLVVLGALIVHDW